MPRKLRILVSGMVAGVPHQGGATWAVLQYVLGLRSLGHEVYLVESVDANRLLPAESSLEKSTNAFYFQSVVDGFGLADASALLVRGSRDTIGMSPERLARTLPACDVHLNISGLLVEPEWTNRIPIRVYLDLDPGFTQLWHAVERIDMRATRTTSRLSKRSGTPTAAFRLAALTGSRPFSRSSWTNGRWRTSFITMHSPLWATGAAMARSSTKARCTASEHILFASSWSYLCSSLSD